MALVRWHGIGVQHSELGILELALYLAKNLRTLGHFQCPTAVLVVPQLGSRTWTLKPGQADAMDARVADFLGDLFGSWGFNQAFCRRQTNGPRQEDLDGFGVVLAFSAGMRFACSHSGLAYGRSKKTALAGTGFT